MTASVLLSPAARASSSASRSALGLRNAARKFNQIDTHAWRRLQRFLVKRKGRNLRPGDTQLKDHEFFQRLGLHLLRGTVHYPQGSVCRHVKGHRHVARQGKRLASDQYL
jgi:hypothetical protein